MSNVHKFPRAFKTPRELVDAHAEAIDDAVAITMTIEDSTGKLLVVWSNQTRAQVLFASEALSNDVRIACFVKQD